MATATTGLPRSISPARLHEISQVRIATGLLVLLGAILGWLVNPWFYELSAYCGAGLIFAGITEICPLAWTIARMPWNQAGPSATTCERS